MGGEGRPDPGSRPEGGHGNGRHHADVSGRGARSAQGPRARDADRPRAARGLRGLLRGRPHQPRGGHLVRALPRPPQGQGAEGDEGRGRLGARRERHDVPAARVHRGAQPVRPGARLAHRRHRRPPRRAGRRGRHRRARVPERDPRPAHVAGQGGPRALLPDLQRAPRRHPGALRRADPRRRPHQLVGRRRCGTHARRVEGAGHPHVPHAAQPRQGRRGQADRLRQHRDGRGLVRDRGGHRGTIVAGSRGVGGQGTA